MKLFLDMDGTLAKFNVPHALERFDKEKGFFARLGAYKNIEIVNRLCLYKDIYVISASPNKQADKDKLEWLQKFMPFIKLHNVTFCRLGQDKAKIIEKKYGFKIDNTCYLLDDYTKNLNEWEEHGGIGIKRITSVSDNSTKKWTGLVLKDLQELVKFY